MARRARLSAQAGNAAGPHTRAAARDAPKPDTQHTTHNSRMYGAPAHCGQTRSAPAACQNA